MENIAKMEFSAFLKVVMVSRGKNDESFLGKLRINPFHITSYYEAFDSKRDDKSITAICVGANTYWIDMSIDEVDEMMEDIERGLSFKE